MKIKSCLAKSARCFKAVLYIVYGEIKGIHQFALTLSFTPSGDDHTGFNAMNANYEHNKSTDFYYNYHKHLVHIETKRVFSSY